MSTLEVILLVIGLAIGVALLMVLAYQMGKHKNLIPVVLSVVGVGIIIFSVYCITDLNYYYNVKGGVYGVITDLFHVNIVEGEEELEFSLSNIALKQIHENEYGAKITIGRTITMEEDKTYIVCVNGIPCTTSEVDKIHAQATYAYTFYDKQMKGFEDTLAFSFAFYPNYTTLSVTTKGGSEAVNNWNSYFQKNNFDVTFEESMFKFENLEQEEEVVDYCITYYVDNEVYEQQLVKSNQTFTLINAPEKKGYTFDGWADAEGNIVEIKRTTQNIDLYAVYTEFEVDEKHHKVSFFVNGELFDVVLVETGECVSGIETPENLETPEGAGYYKFLGWSIDGENLIDLSSYKITKNVDIFAIFSTHSIPSPV